MIRQNGAWYTQNVQDSLFHSLCRKASLLAASNKQYWPPDIRSEWTGLAVVIAFFSIPLLLTYLIRKRARGRIEKMEEDEPHVLEFAEESAPSASETNALQQTIEVFVEVRQIAREENNPTLEMRALREIVFAHTQMQNGTKAIESMEDLVLLSKESDNDQPYCANLIDAGILYCELGESKKATEVAEAALAIASESGEKQSQASALNILGWAKEITGKTREGSALREAGQGIGRVLQNQREEAAFEWRCATICLRLKRPQEAMEYAHKAIQLLDSIRDPLADEIREEIKTWGSL